jgi:hypothetical protein
MEMLMVKLLNHLVPQIINGIMEQSVIIGVLIILTTTQTPLMMEKFGIFLMRLMNLEME